MRSVTVRMGAQSARYVRFTATSLREENGEYRLALGGIGVWFDDYRSVGKVAAEPNATYYISSSEGDDSYDGKTPETAWRTLNRANSLILSGGNRILLKKGDVWTGQMLQPYGDGSKDSPVVISSYGEGDQAPVIAAGGGLATGLLLSNVSWYTVQGIDFSDSPFGIKIESRLKNFDTETHEFDAVEGFVIKDCNFSDHRANSITDELFIMRYPDAYFGAGINLIAYGTRETWGERANNTSSPYIQEGDEPNNYIKNVQIENCDFERCDTGILNYLVDLQSLENGNSGFSSVKFDTEDVNLSIMVDLGKEETFSAVRLFGAQRHLTGAAHYGTMFPRDLTISVSSDGVNWEQMDIHALDENGAAIRGGVKEIKDLTLASRPCQDMRFLLDVTARYVRVDITKAQADPAGSGYYAQIAELQVISGQQFDLKTEYVAVQ